MTRTVRDNALFLEVLAGPDGLDPRQGVFLAPCSSLKANDYSSAGHGAKGIKVAKLVEGFGRDPEVDTAVEDALEKLKALGATVQEVSIPMHSDGSAIFFAICCEGMGQLLDGPTGVRGSYSEGLIRAIHYGLAVERWSTRILTKLHHSSTTWSKRNLGPVLCSQPKPFSCLVARL